MVGKIKAKRPVGRPSRKGDVDWKIVEDMASIMCSVDEIALVLDIPATTLEGYPEFAYIYKRATAQGKKGLRRKQFQQADNNPTMAIWLGKNYLNQTDKQEHTVDLGEGTIKALKKLLGETEL
jgi:hypothetical protein